MKQTNVVNGAIMRKAAMLHKATERCITGVIMTPDGDCVFVQGLGEAKMHDKYQHFDRCPVCGKENK